MDNKQLGNEILELVGGEGNIISLVHCATRLRFKLRKHSEANKDALINHPEVITVVEKGGQFQVVVGNRVGKVYSEIMKNHAIKGGDEGAEGGGEKVSVVSRVFEYISGTFSPLIPALAGAGMIKALLAVLTLLNVLDAKSTTYAVLNAASGGVFYFLPVFVGITAARKLNTNPFVGGAIAAGLLEPNFTALIEQSGNINFLNIPLLAIDYSSTVFPMLIAIAIYALLEKVLKKYTPDTIQLFFVPMISLLIMVPLTALAFGPFAEYVSAGIGSGIVFMLDKSAILTGILIAAAWPILVILGVHWGITPISIANFSRGGDMINPITAAATFAQMGIALGVYLRARKNKNLQSLSFAALLSGLFAGVTEPILYGIILRYKKLIPILLASGGLGGAFIAVFDVRVFTFVFNSMFTIPAYSPMVGYGIGIGISFAAAAILTFIIGAEGKKKEVKKEEGKAEAAATAEPAVTNMKNSQKTELSSPLVGEMIPLENVEDPVFSSGAMGKGVAVEPTEGVVYAPFDGEVSILFPTKHAIGLKSDDGIELLIHVGLDTVQLDGKHFSAYVSQGEKVKKGTKLVTFDIEGIQKEGYRTTTPVIVTNTDQYLDVVPSTFKHVNSKEPVFTVIK